MKQSSINFIKTFLISLFIVSHLILLTQNYTYVVQGIDIGMNPIDLYSTLWDLKYTFNIVTGISTLFICILISANLAMAYDYYKRRGEIILRYNKSKNILAVILSIIGISCASCGVVAASLLLSIVGISMSNWPLHGAELSLIALAIMCYSTYLMYKKYKAPMLC